jgi:hypothetical protein
MPSADHGTRSAYKSGCSCVSCRAAEANYRCQLRQTHRQGKVPLGAIISATDARKLVNALLLERFSRLKMAPQLGINRHTLALDHLKGHRIRYSTLLRLKRLTRIVSG